MSKPMGERIAALDWESLQQSLDEQGYAVLPPLLNERECHKMIESYQNPALFRNTIDMARYRFGIGEYKYYQSPLPNLLLELREGFYPELAKAANRWLGQLGREPDYPAALSEYLDHCHRLGQTRPTPLILKYEAGGYNCLHQDLYGEEFFPFQVVFVLNQKERDYTGGEFLLVEQRPRAQSRGHVIALEQGAGLIFPTQHRPVAGTRGYYRTTLRHGVSTIASGTRYSLGIIFHDAK
ncbi:2OG-Fe(II) oxygenase [Brevibacillus centrosporus]|nr:2OG-Fe(II) oxygenase [Brevibacillus centrosporus]